MSKLDEIIKSERFNTTLKKDLIKKLFLDLIGPDSKFREPDDDLDRGVQIGYDTLRAELRQKVEEL